MSHLDFILLIYMGSHDLLHGFHVFLFLNLPLRLYNYSLKEGGTTTLDMFELHNELRLLDEIFKVYWIF